MFCRHYVGEMDGDVPETQKNGKYQICSIFSQTSKLTSNLKIAVIFQVTQSLLAYFLLSLSFNFFESVFIS